mgnify:CR=1 FL=1
MTDTTVYPDDMYATKDEMPSIRPQSGSVTKREAAASKPVPETPTFEVPAPTSLPDADLPLFTPTQPAAIVSASHLVDRCRQYMSAADVEKIREAYRYADAAHLGQFRKSGEPYITHPIAVASILASWKMDALTIQAGLMHDVLEDTGTSKQEMAEKFGLDVAELVDGVSKLDKLRFSSAEAAQAESFRKMLMAMSRDVRVILVKLADRLHNLRTLGVMRAEKRARIAKETLDIYVPLAHQLGLNNVFRELQELSFANRYPRRYEILYHNVLKQRTARRSVLEKILAETRTQLAKYHIRSRVIGRDKTIYGIYNKMRTQHQSFSDALDIYGFRVIVRSLEDCYLTLCALHSLFKPVHRRFKDFIAIPKMNGYQSIHTTVIGPNGTPIEYQIRTEDMHRVAEYGILTQWLFKNDVDPSDMQSRTSAWLANLMEIQRNSADSSEFLENIKVDLFPNRLYAFTPQGKIISLPKGSTPVDFAYQVHTDVGNHATGCKINGEPRPLSTRLSNGDMVEIQTNPSAYPSPAWLESVRSGKARAEIRQYLRTRLPEESIHLGQEALRKEADANRFSLEAVPEAIWQKLRAELEVPDDNSLYTSIGLGKDLPAAVLHRLVKMTHELDSANPLHPLPAITIRGNEGVAVELSKDCHPIPGDAIRGYSRTGHGLVIHRADCPHCRRGMKAEPSRWLDVAWAEEQNHANHAVPVDILVSDQNTALAAITTSIAEANSSIVGVVFYEREAQQYLRLTLQVRDRGHLMYVIKMIKKNPAVLQAKRVFEAGAPHK